MLSSLLAATITLTNLCGLVEVDLHGARVVSYVPRGGREVMARTSSPTVGGWMLSWPWFGDLKPCEDAPRHGLARYGEFRVVERSDGPLVSELTLKLDSDESTRRFFPHDFSLTVRIRLSEGLSVEMSAKNTGPEPFRVTEAMHPYFAVGDASRCRIEGLPGGTVPVECRGSRDFRIAKAGARFALRDDSMGRSLMFECDGAPSVRVWNPGPVVPIGKNVTPIGPDDWKRFVCVEPGLIGSGYVLGPGEVHEISMSCTAGDVGRGIV